jgi:hypothetical protein
MSDIITQTRLAMRLDAYMSDYKKKNTGKEMLSSEEWDTVWKVAEVARTQNALTPELVDNVRLALHK